MGDAEVSRSGRSFALKHRRIKSWMKLLSANGPLAGMNGQGLRVGGQYPTYSVLFLDG